MSNVSNAEGDGVYIELVVIKGQFLCVANHPWQTWYKGKRKQAWILWVIGSLQFLVTVYANSSAIITVYLFRSCMAEQKSPTLIIKLFASPVSCVSFPPPWLAECFKLNSGTNLIYILFYLI